MTELLRRAAALVPQDARSDAGFSAVDVHEYLALDDWNAVLEVLGDFGGIAWQALEFWELLVSAAKELHLDPKWFSWRRAETLNGFIRADLELPPGSGRTPIPGGCIGLRPMWDPGDGGFRTGLLWVESAPELSPGASATVRLVPLRPEIWPRLEPGDVITMHEGQPVAGTGVILEHLLPRH